MKKIITISIILVFFIFIYHTNFKHKKHKKNALVAGSYAKDFIIGMKNSLIYKLSDFIGKYNIILVFLDTSPQSQKIKDINKIERLSSFLQKNKDILWFNLTKDTSNYLIIEEKTQKINLSYRTALTNMPEFYNFKNLPSIIIINKMGIIQLIYSGYSPMIVNDILDTLKTLAQ